MMRIIDRYIASTVLMAIALVTLMLTGLQVFILFVNQLGDIGRADYGIWQVAFFVLLQVPYQLYLFFPMASLLGCLLGLGVLANHSELVVMRAAGMSMLQITRAVAKAALLLVLLVTLMGETLVPYLTRYANDYKTAAISGGQSIRTRQGMWLRYAQDFVSIGSILPGNVLDNVHQFTFDAAHNLQRARQIRQVRYENNRWVMYDLRQTEFEKDKTTAQRIVSLPWDVPVRLQTLKISGNEPDEMSLYELHLYLREQKQSQVNAHNYQLAYWQRLMQPLTTLVMMLLAIPFIFGPLRSSTMGSKLLVGATAGFGFYILNRFLGPVSLVYQWPPALAAIGPTLLFALIAVYMMRKVR